MIVFIKKKHYTKIIERISDLEKRIENIENKSKTEEPTPTFNGINNEILNEWLNGAEKRRDEQ